MIDVQYLLTDEQMAQFITQGYVQLRNDFPPEFHQEVRKKMEEVYTTEGNPGNNIVPRIPEIQQFFDHPTVRGALTSILGPQYMMHAHRHGHFNPAGSGGMGWHKDNYWGNEKTRNHHPWSAMIFYYPQDVTEDMGPSGIMPGTQYRYNLTKEDPELAVCGQAGTMALINYDIWHKAYPNSSLNNRFMLKFLFFRMEAPTYPTWNNQRTQWQQPADLESISQHPLIWEHVWNWMSGRPTSGAPSAAASSDTEDLAQLKQHLHGEDENAALHAAYVLASMGEQAAIDVLLSGLRDKPAIVEPKAYSTSRVAAHGLAAMGAEAVPVLVEALDGQYVNPDVLGQIAFALGEIGQASSPAIPRLISLLGEESPFIRQHVVEALGMIREPREPIVDALSEAMQDHSDYVRFQAGLALTRMAEHAAAAIPALKQALNDPNRYVSAISAKALERIRSEEALDVLLPFLQTARWCPVTTAQSTY